MDPASKILLAKEFEPNRSRKNVLVFTFLFGLMWLGGLFILLVFFLDPDHKTELLIPGIFMSLLGTLYFILVVFNKNKVKYFADNKSILLKNGKNELTLLYSDIESITELGEKEAEEQMKDLSDKTRLEQKEMAARALQTFDFQKIKETFKLQAQSLHPYKFLSVQLVYSQSRVSGKAYQANVNIPCDCVLIKMKSDKFYYISPLDCMAFVNQTKGYLRR